MLRNLVVPVVAPTQLPTEAEMIKAILPQGGRGRTPAQRNTFYESIKGWKSLQTASEAEPSANKSKMLEDNLATT